MNFTKKNCEATIANRIYPVLTVKGLNNGVGFATENEVCDGDQRLRVRNGVDNV